MTITQFRRQLQKLGLGARKIKGQSRYYITSHGTEQCHVTTAEIQHATTIQELLAQKLRPEYIPPLG